MSPETRAFARERGLREPNIYVPSPDAPPYYPESLREILFEDMEPNGNGKRPPRHQRPSDDGAPEDDVEG